MKMFEDIFKSVLHRIYNNKQGEEIFLLKNSVIIISSEYNSQPYGDYMTEVGEELFNIRYKNRDGNSYYNYVDILDEDSNNIIELMTIDNISDIFKELVKNNEMDELQFILEEFILKGI